MFQNFLKRKHEESEVTATYDAITEAQSTQAQAARANKELDEELRTLLRPLPVGKYTVWPDDFQKAWQANLFEPHHAPEEPEYIVDSLIPHLGQGAAECDLNNWLFPVATPLHHFVCPSLESREEKWTSWSWGTPLVAEKRYHPPEGSETFDFGSLKNSYLAMKESNPWQKSYCRSYRAHNLISTPMRTEDSAGPLGAPQWATKAPLQETIGLELRTVNGYSWD